MGPCIQQRMDLQAAHFRSRKQEMTHTCEVGTVTYTAPEVVDCKPYGLASDMWSVGTHTNGNVAESHTGSYQE